MFYAPVNTFSQFVTESTSRRNPRLACGSLNAKSGAGRHFPSDACSNQIAVAKTT
jgi:hypothetical protein